ncbi:MAG TPA: sugar ABC transporter permease [Thermoflexia bacterium]|jgi:multiple sugar transport system permease protein|nr:sugar ABC transporter permease [Thermoflexia bacterium]
MIETFPTRLCTLVRSAFRARMAYLFLLPGLALFTLFVVYPMLYSLRISFYDWNIIRPERSAFVGLDNYATILQDPIFRRAVLNTLAYTLVTVPAQIVLALIVALLLDQEIRGRTFFRVAYYLPVITSWVIVTLIFEYLFNSQAGLVNYLLRDVLHLVDEPIRWLADPILTMVPIHLLGIWKGVGWSAIILLAALQEIPADLLEAAAVDGAGPWQRLRHVTLPLLRPTLVFLLVVLVIGGLNVYISVLLITDGGRPLDLTHSVLTLMYKETFDRLNFSGGAAISYLLTAFVFVISLLQIRLLRRRVEY